jgi:hypothetical protein
LKRWRLGTYRYQEENARIEDWLGRIEALAPNHYSLAVELAKAQRLVKGYGETHERGWRNFSTLLSQLDLLALRSDGAVQMARLIEAALADEEGVALGRDIQALRASATPQGQAGTMSGLKVAPLSPRAESAAGDFLQSDSIGQSGPAAVEGCAAQRRGE